MSGLWNGRDANNWQLQSRRASDEPWSSYQQQPYLNKNCNYNYQRSRSRDRRPPFSDNSFYPGNKNRNTGGNYRRGGRSRSQSAPRTMNAQKNETNPNQPSNTNISWRNDRRNVANFNPKQGKDNGNNQSADMFQSNERNRNDGNGHYQSSKVKRFRNIFQPEDESKTNVMIQIENDYNQVENDDNADQTKTNEINKSDVESENLSKYFGESLTEIHNGLERSDIPLPVVSWNKTKNVDPLQSYNNECIGGDGITIEVFYLCKYCKMFTGGKQLDAHLRSKYHFDKYKEYLKGSSTSSDSASLTSDTTIDREVPNKTKLSAHVDIDDELYRDHNELDFSE